MTSRTGISSQGPSVQTPEPMEGDISYSNRHKWRPVTAAPAPRQLLLHAAVIWRRTIASLPGENPEARPVHPGLAQCRAVCYPWFLRGGVCCTRPLRAPGSGGRGHLCQRLSAVLMRGIDGTGPAGLSSVARSDLVLPCGDTGLAQVPD